MAAGEPFASVIVPAYRSHETIAASLKSLIAQEADPFEVIVVDSSPDDRCEAIVTSGFPSVRYIRERRRLLPHAARNIGARAARGRVLVFTDPDCLADGGWLARLLEQHRAGRRIVGGAIRSSPGWWNRAVNATKYQWWDPQSTAGPRPELPSGNFSIARDVWGGVQGFRGEYFAGDSELCWRIRSAGHEIWFEPRAIVTHLPHERLRPFLRERYQRGRDFGRMRVALQEWPAARCLAYLAAAPVLPFVMTARSGAYAVRARFVARWLETAPIQLVGNGLWCWGEATVHWSGLWRR
jgi:glycosyltransferase involved in cell wall biosynthesis